MMEVKSHFIDKESMGGSIKIYKFGGTSLGSAGRIKKVAAIIAAALVHNKIVVVVSAIHRVTDLFEGLDVVVFGAVHDG